MALLACEEDDEEAADDSSTSSSFATWTLTTALPAKHSRPTPGGADVSHPLPRLAAGGFAAAPPPPPSLSPPFPPEGGHPSDGTQMSTHSNGTRLCSM